MKRLPLPDDCVIVSVEELDEFDVSSLCRYCPHNLDSGGLCETANQCPTAEPYEGVAVKHWKVLAAFDNANQDN